MAKHEEREEGYRAEAWSFLEPERTPTEVRVEMLDDEREAAEGVEHEGKRLIDAKTPEERELLLLARLSEL